MINKKTIEKLNPCRDRFDNFVTHYGNRSFRPAQFLGLKNITHSDKLWVAFRMLPKSIVVQIAADIAESVLHIYERQYPNDLRPRHAIEAARSGVNLLEARNAAADAADYTADYTTYTAAYAAYTAANAAYAADYTADYTAYTAASAAATGDRRKQEKLIRTIILKYWNKL